MQSGTFTDAVKLHESEKAIAIQPYKSNKTIWIPKSKIEKIVTSNRKVTITVPLWLFFKLLKEEANDTKTTIS